MDDFITNINHEKQVCKRFKFEYLKSEFCRNCYIDTHAVEKSYTWFEDEDFKKFVVYEVINLSKFIDYNFRK